MSSQNGYKKCYPAYIAQDDGWWVSWVQGVRGVNCQERTRKELLDTLKVTLPEILEYDRKGYDQIGFVRTPKPHFEPVTIRLRNDGSLNGISENMVINLEAMTFMPGVASPHIEQTFVVTADGCRPICPQDRSGPVRPAE